MRHPAAVSGLRGTELFSLQCVIKFYLVICLSVLKTVPTTGTSIVTIVAIVYRSLSPFLTQLLPVRSSTLMDSSLEQEPWTPRSRSGT